MSGRVPTRKDHQRFCEVEGWALVRNARGGTGSHHLTYELALPDGRILRTRVSHPPNKRDISRRLFAHILRDQLDVAEDEFWACIDDGRPPSRGRPAPPEREPLPPEIVSLLVTKVGMTEARVRELTKVEAIGILQKYWTSPDDA
ncbi:MAG: cytotoxic translational repressor of toxin-antitoxin stability system [Actinomycetota bacterium]|nr:cytotoxic translational repressor of toxin-antitoxin stability system [Actinomycetota bacterium]